MLRRSKKQSTSSDITCNDITASRTWSSIEFSNSGYLNTPLTNYSETCPFISFHLDSLSLVHFVHNKAINDGSITDECFTNTNFDVPQCSSPLISDSVDFVLDNEASSDSLLASTRYCVCFFHDYPSELNFDGFGLPDFEYRDTGARFYRDHILHSGYLHQNWFGTSPLLGPIAASVALTFVTVDKEIRERINNNTTGTCYYASLQQQSLSTSPRILDQDANFTIPAWFVLIRQEKTPDLRLCVVSQQSISNEALIHDTLIQPSSPTNQPQFKNSSMKQKNNKKSTATSSTKCGQQSKSSSLSDLQFSLLKYVLNDEHAFDYLKSGVPDKSVYEKLIKLDEMELLDNHKFGVLLCKSKQVTEAEMYSNEHTTHTLEEFMQLLGRKVRLKGYNGYLGGLDNKNDATGTETYVTEFGNCNVLFLVSTMLPYEPNKVEQLARKRHIGNASVTFIFQDDDDTPPFNPSVILSSFQKVFIVVKRVKNESKRHGYRVSVCRSKEVPQFGPIISPDYVFGHHPSLARFLLVKAFNAAYAVLKCKKLRDMVHRSRCDYLHQLATEHCLMSENKRVTKSSKSFNYRHNSEFKRKLFKSTNKSVYTSNDSNTFADRMHLLSFSTGLASFSQLDLSSLKDIKMVHKNPLIEEFKAMRSSFGMTKWMATMTQTKKKSNNRSSISQSNDAIQHHLYDLLSFGQLLTVGLIDWLMLDRWHSIKELIMTLTMKAGSVKSNNKNDNSSYLESFVINDVEHNLVCCKVQIMINQHWLLINAPFDGRLLVAIPVSSVFAYLFEQDKKVLRVYFNFGQYVTLYNLYSTAHLDRLLKFINLIIYPRTLKQCTDITLKPMNYTRFLQSALNYPTDNFQTMKLHNQLTRQLHVGSGGDKGQASLKWSLTDFKFDLSTCANLSVTSNPFPYLTNNSTVKHTSTYDNDVDDGDDALKLFQQNQILLQLNKHTLPDFVKAVQSRKSMWALQSVNLSTPFSQAYFKFHFDTEFAYQLLKLIHQIRFHSNLHMIVCPQLTPSDQVPNKSGRYSGNDSLSRQLTELATHESGLNSTDQISTITNRQNATTTTMTSINWRGLADHTCDNASHFDNNQSSSVDKLKSLHLPRRASDTSSKQDLKILNQCRSTYLPNRNNAYIKHHTDRHNEQDAAHIVDTGSGIDPHRHISTSKRADSIDAPDLTQRKGYIKLTGEVCSMKSDEEESESLSSEPCKFTSSLQFNGNNEQDMHTERTSSPEYNYNSHSIPGTRSNSKFTQKLHSQNFVQCNNLDAQSSLSTSPIHTATTKEQLGYELDKTFLPLRLRRAHLAKQMNEAKSPVIVHRLQAIGSTHWQGEKELSLVSCKKEVHKSKTDDWSKSTKTSVPSSSSKTSLSGLTDDQLRCRLQQMIECLKEEQQHRKYLTHICANLMKENRQLRTQQTMVTNAAQHFPKSIGTKSIIKAYSTLDLQATSTPGFNEHLIGKKNKHYQNNISKMNSYHYGNQIDL